MPATFTKLRDGSWGINSTSSVDVGDVVQVDRRDGSSKRVRVERVLSGRNGTWVCSISDLESDRPASRAKPRSGGSGGSRSPRSAGTLQGTRTCLRGERIPSVGECRWVSGARGQQPMVVVGWQVVRIREDGLSFGYPDDEGTFTDVYHRDATDEEAASMRAERDAREAFAKAEAKRRSDEMHAAMLAARAPLEGLVRCTHAFPPRMAARREVGRYSCDGGLVVVQRCEWDGRVAYVETSSFFDDQREYVWASAEEIERLRVDCLSAYPDLTPSVAADWLSRVRGCHGTEFYEWLAARGEAVSCAS